MEVCSLLKSKGIKHINKRKQNNTVFTCHIRINFLFYIENVNSPDNAILKNEMPPVIYYMHLLDI